MKSAVAVAAIALTGLAGMLVGGQGSSQAFAGSDPYLQTLKHIDRQLSAINAKLGATYQPSSVLGVLRDVGGNTYGTCLNTDTGISASPFCHQP